MTEIFLSYASEDSEVAHRVSVALEAAGTTVFYYENPESRGRNFIRLIEEAIGRADLFVVLMSPAYLESHWCKQERDLAMTREGHLRRQFIHVFHVAETPYKNAGFTGTVDWHDLLPPLSDKKIERAVARLSVQQVRSDRGEEGNRDSQPNFHNRKEEIAKVVNALTTPGADDFWLVLAPPLMGKSWFLDRAEFDWRAKVHKFHSQRVDLRSFPPELRADWRPLLGALLEVTPPGTLSLTAEAATEIATKLVRRGCPQLYLVDSAELMTPQCVEQFRLAMSMIRKRVVDARHSHVRLSLVVASRQPHGWKGYGRSGKALEFALLSLTEFPKNVVRDVVGDLDRDFDRNELDLWAEALHSLSEGLPALLVESLRWAEQNEFLVLEKCAEHATFVSIVSRYIAEDLLTDGGPPLSGDTDHARCKAMELALRAIAPYRLFTQSHLRYHLTDDKDFNNAVVAAGWTLEELWQALSGTALLKPSDEIWNALSPPIRRLLYRYYYPEDTVRLNAHLTASDFYRSGAAGFAGADRYRMFVECLWHVATTFVHNPPTDGFAAALNTAAAELAGIFMRHRSPYSRAEVLQYLRKLFLDDVEFKYLVADDDFFEHMLTSIGDNITAGGA